MPHCSGKAPSNAPREAKCPHIRGLSGDDVADVARSHLCCGWTTTGAKVKLVRGQRAPLYDPYVAGTAAGCIFCKIAAGQERSWKVYENEHAVAVLDRSPAVPGHTLVMPRRHAADIWDIGREDATVVMGAVHDVAALLRERLRPDGMTLFQANGAAGWQTVFHLHVHLVPRHAGDRLTASWTPQAATEGELDEVLGRIRPRP